MRISASNLLASVCVLVLLSACGDDKSAPAGGAPAGQKPGAAAQGMPAAEVGVVTLRLQNVDLDVELPGRTSAYQAAEIRPQVNGVILQRLFEEGSFVEKGQQLYQIDPALYKANLNTADAQLKRAEATLKSAKSLASRYKELITFDGVSKQELDDATAALGQAEADIGIARAARETAQINLNYTKVFSPISGRIGKSSVTPGALVTANQTAPLALVQQLDPIYVDVTQSSGDMMALRQRIDEGKVEGASSETAVTLILDELKQPYNQQGVLKFSDVTVDQTTGNVQIRALFPNEQNLLLPGLFVRAIIKQGQLSNVLLVPQQAVVRNPDGSAVAWVVDAEGKAQQKPVELAKAVKDKWIVTGGLQDGDRVIVEGAIKVQPGAPVSAVELEDKSAKPADAPFPEAEENGEAPAMPEAMDAETPAADGQLTPVTPDAAVTQEAIPATEPAKETEVKETTSKEGTK